MKKILVLVLLMFSFAFISAYTYTIDSSSDEVNYPPDNFIGRIISSIKFNGLFTVYGEALNCEILPSYTHNWVNVLISKTVTITLEPGDAMFINWFRGSPNNGVYSDHPGESRQFMDEIWLEYGKTPNNKITITCDAGAYWDNECYLEQYTCPLPCYADSSCGSGKYCDTSILSSSGSPLPSGAGVCKVSSNPTCSSGQTKCEGTVSFSCSNNAWVSNGEVEGKCGYKEDPNCKEEQSVFYTDAEIIIDKTIRFLIVGVIKSGGQATASQVETYIPGFANKFVENKAEACCKGLVPIFEDEKTIDFQDKWGIFGLFTKDKQGKGTYSVYTCQSKDEAGFCFDYAQTLLSKYTHANCQNNTWLFIGGIVVILIFLGFIFKK